jgi:hypothetical protein
VTFSPDRAKKGERVTVTMPGLSDVAVNVVYRFEGKSDLVEHWCKLDANGNCQFTAPSGSGKLLVDWVQPEGRRWIFTNGLLTVAD